MSHLADTLAGEVCVAVEVILVEGVLNTDNGVLLAVVAVLLLELWARLDVLGVGLLSLEVQVVLVVLEEFAGGHIHANLDLAYIARLLHSKQHQSQRIAIRRCTLGNFCVFTQKLLCVHHENETTPIVIIAG